MTGTVEMLPAGAFGVDFSFGRPALDDMLTLGVQFVSRYVCIDNALTHDKLWTLDQLRFYADAGILAMVNYEQGENTTLGGETAGRKHGKVAADWRHYLGMPADMPMPISTDQGVTASQFSAIADFHAAFVDEGGGPVGCYHGTTLCAYLEDRGLNDLTWMAMATSWSPGGETDRVHVRQKGYVLGSCDANYVRKPTPFWNFNGVRPPDPPHPRLLTSEYDMADFRIIYPEGLKYEIIRGRRRDVTDDELFYVLGGVFQRPDGTFADGFGSPVTVPASGKPICFVGDRDKTLALPVYSEASDGGGLTTQDVKAIIDSTVLKTG